jgi:hypothetical protein
MRQEQMVRCLYDDARKRKDCKTLQIHEQN